MSQNVPECPIFQNSLRSDTPPRTMAHRPIAPTAKQTHRTWRPRRLGGPPSRPQHKMRRTNPCAILSHPPKPATWTRPCKSNPPTLIPESKSSIPAIAPEKQTHQTQPQPTTPPPPAQYQPP